MATAEINTVLLELRHKIEVTTTEWLKELSIGNKYPPPVTYPANYIVFVVFNFGVFFRELEMRANATKLLINRVDDVKVYSGYLQRKIEENNIINYSQTFLLV